MDNQIQDELKRLVRRVDTLQKSVDIQIADRNILEDILARLSAVEQALHMNKDHQTEMQKDLKADVKDVQAAVEDKVNEVKNTIGEKTIVVKSKSDSMFAKLRKMLGGGENK